MGIIHQLPEEIAIKIAAGEVVERPASVVKELIENAIDAGATDVEVSLVEGGKALIEIKDNGSGMDREDAVKAFLRHGTSKIKRVEDLDTVATLGFRGEALAAIGASSEVELTTAQAEAPEGTRVVVTHGDVPQAKPHPPILGTTVRVNNLFAALPARQKFLKSEATEWKACLDVITKQMIAHPNIGFVVKHNNRLIFDVPSGQELPSRVAETWRLEQSKLVEVIADVPHLAIYGVVGKPEAAYASMGIVKSRQFLSVNGHPISDKLITKAVKDAFGTLLPPNIYPSFALNLTVHPGMVDVNIHPRKDEVRFVNSQEMFRFVQASVSQALSQTSLAFESVASSIGPIVVESPRGITATSQPTENNWSRPKSSSPAKSSYPSRNATMPHVPLASMLEVQAPTPLPEPILTLNSCYLITIRDGKLLVVDQHAAHERILYNQLWEQDESHKLAAQPLLLPVELPLHDSSRALFNENKSIFENLGFHFSGEKEGELFLLEVPQFLKTIKPIEYFHTVLNDCGEDRPDPDLTTPKHKLFATMACKAAIKAGDVVSEAEKRKLIFDLITLQENASNNADRAGLTCPHGRPSHLSISSSELEKLFKRTGF